MGHGNFRTLAQMTYAHLRGHGTPLGGVFRKGVWLQKPVNRIIQPIKVLNSLSRPNRYSYKGTIGSTRSFLIQVRLVPNREAGLVATLAVKNGWGASCQGRGQVLLTSYCRS